MKLKLLVVAITASLTSINDFASASPLWVNLGEGQNKSQVWIDDQSISKYKTVVKFDMRLSEARKLTSARVVAECNTLTFQYQNLAVNNIASPPPDGIEFPIQQTEPDSFLSLAIYYACQAYRP